MNNGCNSKMWKLWCTLPIDSRFHFKLVVFWANDIVEKLSRSKTERENMKALSSNLLRWLNHLMVSKMWYESSFNIVYGDFMWRILVCIWLSAGLEGNTCQGMLLFKNSQLWTRDVNSTGSVSLVSPSNRCSATSQPIRVIHRDANMICVEELNELFIEEPDRLPAYRLYSSKMAVKFHPCNFLKQPITVPARQREAPPQTSSLLGSGAR